MPMTEKQLNWLAEITGNTSLLMTASNALDKEKTRLEKEKNKSGISPEDKEKIEEEGDGDKEEKADNDKDGEKDKAEDNEGKSGKDEKDATPAKPA